MTEERWTQVKEIFLDAVALPSSEWPEILARSCGSDPELRQAVDELLQRAKTAPEFESPLRFTDLTGRTIGRYGIREKLGQGGMGVVYKAEDTVLHRVVALKFLAPEVTANEEFKSRFVDEARAAAALDHPNLCTLYAIEEVDGRTFLVMAYVPGKTLKEIIQEGPLPVDRALDLAIEAATGLQEAHRKGVVHRDIKPSNIILCDDRRAVITDFGLAQREGQTRITQSGQWIGTPAYMAPEVIRGEQATPASDVWSLGVILYEAVSGRLPFPEKPLAALVLAIQNDTPVPLKTLCPEVSSSFSQVVGRMMARNPSERYTDVGELLRDLNALKSPTATSAVANTSAVLPTGGGPRPKSKGQVKRRLAAALLGLIVIAVSYRVLTRSVPAPVGPMEVLPLTSYDGMEDGPSFSPDGEQVAFSWQTDDNKNWEICVKLLADSRQRCITQDPLPDLLPSWSPDGKWIAFLRAMKPGVAGVYLTSPLGGEERELTEISARDALYGFSRLAWTPDSASLILSDRDPVSHQLRLWRMPLDATERVPLTTPPAQSEGDRNPALSPDGRSLVFVREGFVLGDLYVQSLSPAYTPEGEARRLTSDGRFIAGTAWIPGTNDVLFSASQAVSRSNLRIWRIGVDRAEKPRLQEPGMEGSFSPTVSADGHKMAFTRYQNDQNIWRLDRPSATGEWSAPRKFTEVSSTRDEGYVSFSPDGAHLAFVSNRAGGFDIWVSNPDGSNARQLTNLGTLSGSLAWSPDGKQIAFDWSVNGNWDVFLISLSGGQPRRLTDGATDDTVINWSRDGSYVYFNSNRTGKYQVWKAPTAGGPPSQVTTTGGYFSMESVDGKNLYYSLDSGPGPLRRLTFATGEDVEVIPALWPLCFAVTSRGIFYIPAQAGEAVLRFLDFPTGRNSDLASLKAPVSEGITISADEKTILYAQRDQVGSDLALVRGFR